MDNEPYSEQPQTDVVLLIARERIALRPALLLQIGQDMLTRDRPSLLAKQCDGLTDADLVMAHPTMAHAIGRLTGKGIKPAVNRLERLAKEREGFCTVVLNSGHVEHSLVVDRGASQAPTAGKAPTSKPCSA